MRITHRAAARACRCPPAGAPLLGVNVYRGNKRMNRRLLGASGGFLDRSAPRGMTYTYRLQAVALDGTRLWLATATAA